MYKLITVFFCIIIFQPLIFGQKLNVEGNGPSDGIEVTRLNSTVKTHLWSDVLEGGVGTNSNHDFRFVTNNSFRGEISAAGNWGIATTSPVEKLDVNGAIKIGNTSQNFPGSIRFDGAQFEARDQNEWVPLGRQKAVHTESSSQNNVAVDIPDQNWVPIGQSFTITKTYDDSQIELEYNGYASYGTITSGFGLLFELRIDGTGPDVKSRGSLQTGIGTAALISVKSIYENLPSGTYTVSMYVQAPNINASATNVILDPGGWSARILATEN